MIQFVLGAIFGGFVAFVAIVILGMNKTDDEQKDSVP